MQRFLFAVLAELIKLEAFAVVCGLAFGVPLGLIVQVLAHSALQMYKTFL